ncbi:MAG: penicillin-binding protein 2 [Chromatiales bacterium]|jgi:penicillin-binding protein 2
MPRQTIKNYQHESQLFLGRALAAAAIVVALLALLVGRLVDLQVFSHDHFKTQSRENRVKLVPLPPTRGLIYDRTGLLLAQNLPAYSLEVTPERVEDMDAMIEQLRQVIEITEEDVNRFERLRSQRRRFDSIPIRVRLSQEEVARFAVNRHRFPGVDIEAKLVRDYPQGANTAHVLGYVGRINREELERIDVSNYAGTSHIGKLGVEKTYEDVLHGQVGLQQVEVNASGRVLQVLKNEPPVPGRDLHLHLDAALQAEAFDALGDYNGSVVAIDPRTGGVLALVSKPGFDPNLFVEGISRDVYRALMHSEDKPLFNRALRGQYPPGSTIKPFLGLAGLETGAITPEEKRFCPGFYQLPGHTHKYRDWKKSGHGLMDVDAAVTQSCDVFFYKLAHDLGIDRIHDFMSRLGFGARTGVDLVGELGGLLPSRAWKRRARNQPWYPGETLITGIGQGYFLVTPLQLASATATLASDGRRIAPRVAELIDDPATEGAPEYVDERVERLQWHNRSNWEHIVDAMVQVVEGPRGTARRIRSDGYRIAGKTGTAQVFSVGQDEEYEESEVDKKLRDHALFIAFAPAEDPKIAVAVVVENGGHGGSVAAPVAARLIDFHLRGESEQRP